MLSINEPYHCGQCSCRARIAYPIFMWSDSRANTGGWQQAQNAGGWGEESPQWDASCSSKLSCPPICLQVPLLESVPGNYLGIPTWIFQNQCQNQPNKPTQGMLISVSSSTALAQGNEDHSAPLGECVHTHSSRRVSVFLCNTSVLKQICLLRRAKD